MEQSIGQEVSLNSRYRDVNSISSMETCKLEDFTSLQIFSLSDLSLSPHWTYLTGQLGTQANDYKKLVYCEAIP